MRNKVAFYPLFFLVFICGCRLGPSYQKPDIAVPNEWKEAQETTPAPVFESLWWEVFNDETLSSLECQAIAGNPNLLIALDRVAQARAIAGVDRSALYPQLNLNPSYSNTAQLFKIFLPNNGTFLPPNFPTIFRIHQLQYALPLTMSYEVDLWGKLKGQYESAIFQAQMQEDNLQAALLTLTTDLATNYFKLRAFDAMLDVLEDNLDLLQKNVQLVETRFKKGLISELDVVQAKQQLADNEATYIDTLRQRALQEHAIAALLGIAPADLCLAKMPLVMPPPMVQPSLPSQVLLQRPDIRAAERSMAAQHVLIGVAYASFFPSLQLTGTIGYLSPDIRQFLQWKSRLWSMGLDAAQPIFDAGYNESNLKLAYAQYYETLHSYEQTVLTALREVEDSLTNIQRQDQEYEKYIESSTWANKQIHLATTRYRKGLSNYLSVLDSERTKIQTDINRANVLGLRYIATIQLIKALGGSWSFSLQSSFEKPGCCSQGAKADNSCWPDVIENNVSGHIL